MNNHETVESASSYAIGGASIAIGTLTEIANVAQSVAIIIGCAVVLIRLIHDSVRLYRYIKEKPPKG